MNILEDEIVLRPAWRSQWKGLLVIIILIIAHANVTVPLAELVLKFVISILILRFLISHYSRLYMIGPKGIEVTVGFYSRDFHRTELAHIRGVNAKQSIFGRLFSVGKILVATSNEGGDLVLSSIKNPVKYEKIISARLKNFYGTSND